MYKTLFKEGKEIHVVTDMNHIVKFDQRVEDGGNNLYPSPVDYFLASIMGCASYYLRGFFLLRDFNPSLAEMTMETKFDDEGILENLVIKVKVPSDFPEKYKKSLIASMNKCKIKKIIKNQPNMNIELSE